MAQDRTVMAFRKRLKNRGYDFITIKHIQGIFYQVTAREPLAGAVVTKKLDYVEMSHMFR